MSSSFWVFDHSPFSGAARARHWRYRAVSIKASLQAWIPGAGVWWKNKLRIPPAVGGTAVWVHTWKRATRNTKYYSVIITCVWVYWTLLFRSNGFICWESAKKNNVLLTHKLKAKMTMSHWTSWWMLLLKCFHSVILSRTKLYPYTLNTKDEWKWGFDVTDLTSLTTTFFFFTVELSQVCV